MRQAKQRESKGECECSMDYSFRDLGPLPGVGAAAVPVQARTARGLSSRSAAAWFRSLRVVLSHPCHGETVAWMGHPAWSGCGCATSFVEGCAFPLIRQNKGEWLGHGADIGCLDQRPACSRHSRSGKTFISKIIVQNSGERCRMLNRMHLRGDVCTGARTHWPPLPCVYFQLQLGMELLPVWVS